MLSIPAVLWWGSRFDREGPSAQFQYSSSGDPCDGCGDIVGAFDLGCQRLRARETLCFGLFGVMGALINGILVGPMALVAVATIRA